MEPITLSRDPGTGGIHHVGIRVEALEPSLLFWEELLGIKARFRGILDRPYLARIVAQPGATMDAAFLDLPGGGSIELLHLRGESIDADITRQEPRSNARTGDIHICLEVDDAAAAWERAVRLGAEPVTQGGPVDIDGGPNTGARAAYLRGPDGVTIELFQPPPAARQRRADRDG
jgi:glyoxylase I family protein